MKGPNGEARFETIADPEEVIKLAGRAGALDLVDEFGFPEDRLAALDWVTRLAMAAGIDALRDAGIPLVRRYKTTSTGSRLPVGWGLPESMRDDTGDRVRRRLSRATTSSPGPWTATTRTASGAPASRSCEGSRRG